MKYTEKRAQYGLDREAPDTPIQLELSDDSVYKDSFGYSEKGEGVTMGEMKFETLKCLAWQGCMDDEDVIHSLYHGRLKAEDVSLQEADYYEIAILEFLSEAASYLTPTNGLNDQGRGILKTNLRLLIERAVLQPFDLVILKEKASHGIAAVKIINLFLKQYISENGLDRQRIEELDGQESPFLLFEELTELVIMHRSSANIEQMMEAVQKAMGLN